MLIAFVAIVLTIISIVGFAEDTKTALGSAVLAIVIMLGLIVDRLDRILEHLNKTKMG